MSADIIRCVFDRECSATLNTTENNRDFRRGPGRGSNPPMYGGAVNRSLKSKTPKLLGLGGFGDKSLAMTYFHTGSPHYHRRKV
ncbi:hypothetical protein K6V90_21975, partial [Cupriavidus pauculus]|uniref:hypothetical protein n=1 Tax=Cupriavidus pauculus TaxID=82633 RepID=UPI001C931AA7